MRLREQGGLRLRGGAVRQHVEVRKLDLRSNRTDLRCLMCFVARVWGPTWWPMCFIARGRGIVHWLLSLMTDEVFFFRLGFWFQFLLYLMNRWTRKLGFGFFFFFFWESVGLLPSVICWVCFTLFFFFRLSLLYHLMFRIYVGLFFPGELALLQIFFFCLKVE